ncbi:MAG: hypothetical protein WBG50_21720 [Desulfomonilaceae bacterium]
MPEQRWQLWVALIGLSLGGFMLHFRIHPPKTLTYFWPSLFSGVHVVVVSLLFLSRRTAVWGLLLNSFLAFIGIIMMTDFTIFSTLAGSYKASPSTGPLSWLLESMFPDNCVLFADFLVGLALYRAVIYVPKN